MTHQIIPDYYATIFFLLTGLLVFNVSYSQRTIVGRVVEASTGTIIAETNLQIEGAQGGTTTDSQGRFSMKVNDTTPNIIVSHIGYKTRKIPVSEIGTEIQLEEQIYQIGEVSVKYVSLRKLLIKKWRIDDSSIDEFVATTLENMKNKDPEKYEKLSKKPDSMKEAAKLIRLVFHEDGAARIKALLFFGQTFEWKLDEDSRTIVLIDKEGNERTKTISELTANKLIIKGLNKAGSFVEMSYVPAN